MDIEIGKIHMESGSETSQRQNTEQATVITLQKKA